MDFQGNNVIYECSANLTTPLNVSVTTYIEVAGRTVAKRTNDVTQFMITDHLGSTRVVFGVNGVVSQRLDYKPFGEDLVTTTERGEKYTGKTQDGIGLYYYGARYYDPELGRFVSVDPARDGLNWYVYCDNRPITHVDLNGLAGDWAGLAILSHYLVGSGTEMNIVSKPKWSNYMMENDLLAKQTASVVAREVNKAPNNKITSINTTVHMDIENGEEISGYQYLHGSNKDVGDFNISGTIAKDDKGNATMNLRYEWNDMIDPNPKYQSDMAKNSIAEIITFGYAQVYEIHISWWATSKLDENGYYGWPFTKSE